MFGRVRKAIRRHQSTNYWELYTLPSQTKSYIPNIMAAIIIATDPEKYGFKINSEEDFQWTDKKINKSVKLQTISECGSIDIKILQKFNPELKQASIPPLKENEHYILRIPNNISKDFDFNSRGILSPDISCKRLLSK